MNLVKNIWTDKDIKEFNDYILILKSNEKDCTWEKKIVNTKLDCFGKTSFKAKQLCKEIKKGNFISFIEKLKIENHLHSLLIGYLISSIKDFDNFEKFLLKYVLTIDNWASCDTIKFKNKNKKSLESLSKKLLLSDKCFVKRVGINIYFELIKDKNYVKNAFDVLNSLKNEKEYYVNMCGAWLLCELFVKNRDETLEYFKNNSTNSFIINKAISKCRDSFRISVEDKELLKKYKRVD